MSGNYRIAFESAVVPKEWRSCVTVLLSNSKGKKTGLKKKKIGVFINLSANREIYAGVVVGSLLSDKVILTDDEQGRS